jgi:ATP-dependent RNA helicase SUPV3L1/SUV3
MPRRVEAIEAAGDAELGWQADHRLSWAGVAVARLRPGAGLLSPSVDVFDSEFLDGPRRERVRVRLQRFVTGRIEAGLAPLFAAEAKAASDPALRGVLHRLIEAGGVLPGATEASVPAGLRAALKELGVKAGRFALFMPALLKPLPSSVRAALLALRAGVALPALPAPGKVSIVTPILPAGFAGLLGWVEAGPAFIRLDIAERVAAELSWAARLRAAAVPDSLASRLAVSREMLPAVLRGLGMRLLPAAALLPNEYGPPAPAMMQVRRPPRPTQDAVAAPARPDSPFAALASMRR